MKKLVQSTVAVMALGLLAGIWVEGTTSPSRQPTWPPQSQDPRAAKLTDQFLNQLIACSSH